MKINLTLAVTKAFLALRLVVNKLISFGLMLMHQVLFGENTILLVENAYEDRVEERKDILEAKQKLAEELAKREDPTDQYINN